MRIRKDGILEYTINRKEEIIWLIKNILPYLVLKKEQAKLLLEIFAKKEKIKNSKDFAGLMELVNKFEDLNYSKKRIRRSLTP